jgi:FkbM family methyltransferase
MNSLLKLKFEWPGLSKDDLVQVVQDHGIVEEGRSCLEWTLPLGCQVRVPEVIVRHAPFPLQDDSGAINVRALNDLRKLVSIRPEGGLHRLLCAVDVTTVTNGIEARLRSLRNQLSGTKGVYVFAAHRNAAKCVRYCQQLGFEVVGFIDNDKLKQGHDYLGRRVFSLEDVRQDAVIVNASGRYCVEIKQQLEQAGYRWSIDLMEFLFLYDLPFQAQDCFRKYVTDIVDNRLRIASLYLMLADDFSRSVLDGLLLFRLTLDSATAGKISSPYREEFFAEDVQLFGDREVFVDGGAFDGDSFLRFAQLAPGFSRAYLFEPDAAICERAKQQVAGDDRVSVCNFGLWSRSGELRFSSTGGMDGAICEDGDIRVQVVAVDEYVKETVTHIKLDVEGAEEQALLGARHQVRQSRPKMAVALYHRAADLWKIPALIEALGGRYAYSIRHYSQTIDDSIIYARPMSEKSNRYAD